MGSIPETDQQGWQSEVLDAPGAVLVDFWAEWCSQCRMMEPLLAKLLESLAGSLAIVKVDVQACPDLAERYGVMNLPTLVLFKQGEAVEQMTGHMPLRVLENKVRLHL
ncbi:MAG: thioredoxin [Anaerolineae bacterium]